MMLSERKLAAVLVLPAVILMTAVTLYPMCYAVYLSFFNQNLAVPEHNDYIGFSNYLVVLKDYYWWHALWVTLVITASSVTLEFLLGLGLALVLRYTVVGSKLMRIVILIPYAIVTVVAAYSWLYAWTPGTGYLANLLPAQSAVLTHQVTSLAVIVLSEVWKTTPFVALLLLAGLMTIPQDVLLAATLDGASQWQRLIRIILPMLKPSIAVALLFRILDAFRIFDNVYILTAGSHETYTVSMVGYDNLFKVFNLGLGSAISVLIFVCVALIAGLFIKILKVSVPGMNPGGQR